MFCHNSFHLYVAQRSEHIVDWHREYVIQMRFNARLAPVFVSKLPRYCLLHGHCCKCYYCCPCCHYHCPSSNSDDFFHFSKCKVMYCQNLPWDVWINMTQGKWRKLISGRKSTLLPASFICPSLSHPPRKTLFNTRTIDFFFHCTKCVISLSLLILGIYFFLNGGMIELQCHNF